jgi:Cu(I)/Ag(I) efflux system membrane fusion protein
VRDVIPVLAEHDGVLTAIAAREGAYVMPAQPVLSYADPRAAAVEIALSPEQLGALSRREEALVRSTVDRGVVWRTVVERDRAVVDGTSRQVKLRAALPDSPAMRLAFPPGSLAQIELRGASRPVLSVPRDALLEGGEGSLVVVAESNDHFRAIPVEPGSDNGDRVEIRAGLRAGQQVVVNGQFLIGAEASLQAARQRLNARRVAAATGAHDGQH